MFFSRNTLLLSSLLLAAGCGSDEEPSDSAPTSGTEGSGEETDETPLGAGGEANAPTPDEDTLLVGTFNTGLAVVVKGGAERLPLVAEAVRDSEQDILCLQELFSPTSPESFAEDVSSAYPHSFYSDEGDSFLGNGLLILSRFPLDNENALLFDAVDPTGFTDRMVIGADALVGETRVRILCSHLIAGLDEDGMNLRSAQIDELVQFSSDEGYLDSPTVLLGDFNMGPDLVGECTPDSDPACLAPDETNYAKLLETYEDPNDEWSECTQCRDSFLPLQTLNLYENEPDQRIDHCFTLGLEAWSFEGATTLFDEEQSIESGGETLLSLSDHVGVGCDFRRHP